MPSIIRSLPVPRHISHSHDSVPGVIVDLETARKRSSTVRSSGEFSIRSSKSSQESLNSTAGTLDIQIESPPIVCYGSATESSGAILSGMLWLKITPWEVELESLKMSFQTVIATKKPVVINCPSCTSKTTDLHTWEFINGAHPVSHGQHSYPFGYHVPGHLPATTNSTLGSIKYQLFARGITVQGEVIQFTREIKVSRSTIEGPDKTSHRIFPPTILSATVTLPSVIYRGGSFPVEMQLEGITSNSKSVTTRWKLRKVIWRIEEKSKIVSPACKVHAHKIGGAGKGVQYEDIKVLATEEFKNGWKSDFSGDGRIEFAFSAGIPASAVATDDVDNTAGLSVSHNLVLELIVSEEYISKGSKIASPTGSARVLRMQFNTKTTARAGMGISWEDECPPLYGDVPSSPPTYQTLIGTSDSLEDLAAI